MTETDLTVLVGKVRERTHPTVFNEEAWRRALAPLDAARAGTVLVRYLAALRAEDPTLSGFLNLYDPSITVDKVIPPPPRTSPPATVRPDGQCDVCDSTGCAPVDVDDPTAGVRPCTCWWGAQRAPALRQLAPVGHRPVEVVVDPPWRRLGCTAAEWTQRQANAS
jgi:hypothetical protein